MHKILLIEDDAAIRLAVKESLESENYFVDEVDNASAALKKNS